MLRVLLALLALAVTARAQDEGTSDPLARDKTLLASADDSSEDGPPPAQPKMTGAELFEGLEELKRAPQLDRQMEELGKKMEASTPFTLSNILDMLRVYFLGGDTAWRKEFDLRSAELDALFARSEIAFASSEFVKAVHDAERGVSFSCPPDHTMGEMFEMVRVWLQENPGERHLPAETCVVNALKAKWPKTANGPAAKDTEKSPQNQEAR